jgi:hypothetical protein
MKNQALDFSNFSILLNVFLGGKNEFLSFLLLFIFSFC